MVLAGGVDAIQNPFAYLCFSKTHALSPNGRCRPSTRTPTASPSARARDGRAQAPADAERDGDRIYAVIRGVGAASDGRDRSLTAPRPEGQMRALRRAYAQRGVSPATVGLIEAHGTGTVAGDGAEVEALSTLLRRGRGAPGLRDRVGQVDDRPHEGDRRRRRADQGRAGPAPPRAPADDRRRPAEPEGRSLGESVLRQQRGPAVDGGGSGHPGARASVRSASAGPTSTSCSRSTGRLQR